MGPAEDQIAVAQRILVSADGPLLTLPFAALVRKGHYLVDWKPVHSTLSATVYAELKRTRRASTRPAQSQFVAFGDPIYPQLPDVREAPAGTLEILTAVRRGLSLDPIPVTRKEVESIASLFPRGRAYVGGEATEEHVKSFGAQARLLHFACHGLLNERFPLDSALALTIPEHPAEGQENGLLQAWEILESVRLDADLVTLSACDTALGQEVGGEGLIGLTRAFQYAGARSVLASLWSVSDASTGDLMKYFYGSLQAGKSKDAALQAAQMEMIRSPAFSHPYYWAAFQLVGDWK
jgi:CHAT domain-containing protein